jgi:hypothetical protein
LISQAEANSGRNVEESGCGYLQTSSTGQSMKKDDQDHVPALSLCKSTNKFYRQPRSEALTQLSQKLY